MARIRLPIRKVRVGLANLVRRRRHVPPYILLNLSGEIGEIPPARLHLPIPFARFFLPPEPWSVSTLRAVFEQLALDPRVECVVLRIECAASAATYQSLRQLLLDFRASGKRLVAYGNSFGPFQYYLACACNEIIMPPSAEWNVVGLLREYLFLKDALDQLGIGIEVINVSPFKSAFDQFARTDFSDEARAQAEWLLNAQFDELVRVIAAGRHLSEDQVREAINSAPLGAPQAIERGMLDAALYEDEVESHLAPAPHPAAPESASDSKQARGAGRKHTKHTRRLGLYADARNALLIPYVDYAPKVIGVVRIEGTIIEGQSQSFPSPIPLPFFGNRFTGSDSVAQALRRAASDDHIAAIILYVDSGGGSALASDLIAHEVRRARDKKPLLAYMSGAAASGGYYVAALAQRIIAQPLTITGSIGVITMKPNVQRAQQKLFLHQAMMKRGERAAAFSPSTPLSADEYAALAASVQRAYSDFKRIVAEGRALSVANLESIAGGRVWTGAMAKERGLVDTLGDFRSAVDAAREMAGMPTDKRPMAVGVAPSRKFMLPASEGAEAGIRLGLEQARTLLERLGRAHTWAMLPWQAGKSD